MRNKFIVVLLACVILSMLAACLRLPPQNNTADQAAQLVEKGNALSRQGNYDEAIGEYTAAIELAPDLVDAYLARGQAYYFKDGGLMAVSDYSEAIELDPESTAAYYGRGWANLANRAYDAAISDFTKAIGLDPALVRAYNGRGWAYLNKAQWLFESYNYLFILFESHSDLAMAFRGRGWLYVKQPQWELAVIPDLAKAMIQDPDPAEAYCNVGFAHARKAQWAHAIADYEAAIAINPKLDWSRFNKSWALGMKANWDPVIADYSKIIELVTSQVPPAADSGSIPTEDEEWNLAIDNYNEVIKLSKDPALTQKAKEAIALIDEIRQDINR
jgi:tetratricopeptide (TPR) repeat protein